MKMSEQNNNYWGNFPEELRLMCFAEVRGRKGYCTTSVLKYLIAHMDDCDTYIFETTPYDVIHWIDTAVEMCLFPLEQYEEEWIARKDYIGQVLGRAEELLNRVAPMDYKDGYRTMHEGSHTIGIIEYAQKLNVYFCILYMYTEEWQKLQGRLNQLLAYTEQNVRHMLSCENAEEYASCDDWAEFHYAGTDAWEPLNWLCRESIPSGRARQFFADVYEKYVLFLHKLCEGLQRPKACSHLCANAENRLRTVCNHILDEIYEAIEENEGNENLALEIDKEHYEAMLRRFYERRGEIEKDCISLPF